MSSPNQIPVRVVEVVEINPLIKRIAFEQVNGDVLPAFSAGAHVVVEMEDGETKRQNPYSLMSSPFDRSRYAISVRRLDEGRGGSLFMHKQVQPGMEMKISQPVNLFPLDMRAKKHLLIAGGIGITPFIAQMEQLASQKADFELHYKSRTAKLAAYRESLKARFGDTVHTYCSDENDTLDLASLLSSQPLGTHIYVCGPEAMIDAVRQQAATLGWPEEQVHFEHFQAPPTGEPFSFSLAASGKTISVGEQQSMLEALEAAGVDAPYLCRGGVCGQCETNVVNCEGELLHNDHWLSEEQRLSKTKIMPCVSRFTGASLVIDR